MGRMKDKKEEKTNVLPELEKARNNAWSFPGLIPPTGAKEIGREKRGTDEFIYYSDGKGNYWFDTKQQIEFKKEMKEAQNRRRWRRRR